MSAIVDSIVSIVVLLIFAMVIYNNVRNQSMRDTLREIKYAIEEMKGGSEEELYDYGRGYI